MKSKWVTAMVVSLFLSNAQAETCQQEYGTQIFEEVLIYPAGVVCQYQCGTKSCYPNEYYVNGRYEPEAGPWHNIEYGKLCESDQAKDCSFKKGRG